MCEIVHSRRGWRAEAAGRRGEPGRLKARDSAEIVRKAEVKGNTYSGRKRGSDSRTSIGFMIVIAMENLPSADGDC